MAKVELRGVHVSYPIFGTGRHQSILPAVARAASFGVIGRSNSAPVMVQALRGVGFTLNDGDRLGVIGRNGSGKSTLLKTLAGIAWPQQGYMSVQGQVSSIISMGAGLNRDRTGLENVDFIGRLFGLGPAERRAMAEDIIEFTQLNEFLDLPVGTYSAGMTIRLSYALATALPGDILVVDEVLGAGDAIFQDRAAARTKAKYKDAKIFVMATHSDRALDEFCNYAIWLDRGQIIDHGEPLELWQRYINQSPLTPEGDGFKRRGGQRS